MKILFITLFGIDNIEERGIYTDLMRCFVNHGHDVIVVSPIERKFKRKTQLTKSKNCEILRVKCLNIQKTNIFEKTIGTFFIDIQIKKAIQKHIKVLGIDLILYSTPPITLTNTIQYCKEISGAKTYLLLKDIFPQNAVDLNFITTKSPLYKYFRKKEKELYGLSDKIGCMSPANVEFVRKHNPEVESTKLEICPNSIYPIDFIPNEETKNQTRLDFDLPLDKRIFIYGGNLGKPQGVDFIIEFLDFQKNNNQAFFVIVGSGTEYPKIEKWYQTNKPQNIRLLTQLPKNKYDDLMKSADVGMIFLDHRFTIPNFPSRLLSYMEYEIPVIAATDKNTDIGLIIEKYGFGKWSLSNDLESLNSIVEEFTYLDNGELNRIGKNGRTYLDRECHVENAYSQILKKEKIER